MISIGMYKEYYNVVLAVSVRWILLGFDVQCTRSQWLLHKGYTSSHKEWLVKLESVYFSDCLVKSTRCISYFIDTNLVGSIQPNFAATAMPYYLKGFTQRRIWRVAFILTLLSCKSIQWGQYYFQLKNIPFHMLKTTLKCIFIITWLIHVWRYLRTPAAYSNSNFSTYEP